MTNTQETSAAAEQLASRTGRSWWFWLAIGVFVCLFAVVIHQRNRIRAHWWGARLAETTTEDPTMQAYYLASLAAVGDSATGAINRLARHERADVRALAVVALARLPDGHGLEDLRRLLEDDDRDVAESAALSLAFMSGDGAGDRSLQVLTEAASSDKPMSAAAAIAALSRIHTADALEPLCGAAAGHLKPLVRAQAVESLGAWLRTSPRHGSPTTTRPVGDSDPVSVLVAALSDQGTFSGRLSLERQIDAAEAAMNEHSDAQATGESSGHAASKRRTVAEVAAASLGALTGRTFDHQVERTTAQQADLITQCHRRLVERAAAEDRAGKTADGG